MPIPSTSILFQSYVAMVRIRRFEECLGDLVAAGRVKTPCHLYIGQEAVAAGTCAALVPEDAVWGCHRSHGHYLAKGGDLNALMAEILGKEAGCSRGRGGSMHVYDAAVGIYGTVPLVAATIPIAVGAALSFQRGGKPWVSVAFFGDGATEEGHFHEAMNLAARFRLPVLFVCENNLYASHLHLLERRAKDNIVASAEAHGMPGACVDGNDVEAVQAAATLAVGRARAGGGPTLLEMRTFRWRGHVGPSWDTDVGVKRNDTLQEWLPRDPIQRTLARLLELGVPGGKMERARAEVEAELAAALAFAEQAPYPEAATVLDHVFIAPGPGREG